MDYNHNYLQNTHNSNMSNTGYYPADLLYSMEGLEVLCAERVTQMTRAYNDIDAVTHLLEEKERDLELAARIGQSLLLKNHDLERKLTDIEDRLNETVDKNNQLRHELAQKDTLLQVYMKDEEATPETPEDERLQASVGVVNMAGLQKKVRSLEEENLALQSQTAHLTTETIIEEEKEERLLQDCISQLEEYKIQVGVLEVELYNKTDVTYSQQEEITNLNAQIISIQGQLKKSSDEMVELTRHYQAAQETQRELATEILEHKTKNEELEGVFHEAQEEMKGLKKKQKPAFIRHHANYNSPFLPEGSLALELEDSMRKEIDCPPGYTPKERRKHNTRVMETARVVQKAAQTVNMSPTSSAVSNGNGNESCESIVGSSNRSSLFSDGDMSETGYGADLDSMHGSSLSMMNLGRPGLPGSNDLETALRRLTLIKAHESQDPVYRKRRHAHSDESDTATPCRTPDSMMSLGSFSNLSELSRMSGTSTGYRIPKKLEIVKPLEGSYTLHQWKKLATPHLAGVLEHRPGVQNKGENVADMEEEEVYSLSDYEEDDDYSLHLGKCMEQTTGIYTYTTANVLHPSDEYSDGLLTPTRSTEMKMTTYVITSQTSTSTPKATSSVSYAKLGGHCTSTFSMSSGLAEGLHERGLHGQQGGCRPKKTAPLRYGNIVTETISGATNSQTELLYCTASTRVPIVLGRDSLSVLSSRRNDAYLHLVDKVKDVGLNSILGIADKSGVAPVKLDPVDAGLNVIMSIKRNRGAMNRGMAEKASQTIQYARYVKPKARLYKQDLSASVASLSTTQTLLTNSSKLIMAAPLPSSDRNMNPIVGQTPTGRVSPTPSEDCDLLKTLPSVLVVPSGDKYKHKRPDSLLLSDIVHERDAGKSTTENSTVSNTFPTASDCRLNTVVTVSGDTISSGLLSHLSSIYAKTKDILSAPASSLLPMNSESPGDP